MLIFKLIHLIRGYVVIRSDALNSEKILNILRRKNIRVWDAQKNDKGIRFKISYEDYIRNSHLMDEIMKPVAKKGARFKFEKLKLRRGFSLGIIILIITLYLLSSMIWEVEVVGTSQTKIKEIMAYLEEKKIRPPLTLSNKEAKKLENLIYNNFDYRFVDVILEGSKLIIIVKEKEAEPAQVKTNEPSSIISSKNAIISKVIAKSGQPVVREGDVVYEGQTLIMGLVKKKNSDEFMVVPSDGIVYGKTYYNFEMKEGKRKKINVSTNASKSVYYLKIKGNNIKIIGDKEPYENYNYREKVINLPILSRFTDISLLKRTCYEEIIKEIEIDKTTAENKMKISMYDELLKRCDEDSRILKSTINFSEDDEFYYMLAQIEVIEDIGERVRIYPQTREETEEKTEE